MSYCLGCGMLRDTINGFCYQCLKDNELSKHRKPAATKKQEYQRKKGVAHGSDEKR